MSFQSCLVLSSLSSYMVLWFIVAYLGASKRTGKATLDLKNPTTECSSLKR